MERQVISFIRKTGVIAGIFNLVLNPFFAWLGNMDMADVPLIGVALDTAITCVIMSFLVALFISADTRRALKSGPLVAMEHPFRVGCLLRLLPVRPWQLGLLLGFAAAVVVTPWLIGFFYLFGLTAFSFPAFALLKAVYTPPVAYAVARCTIMRQIASATPNNMPVGRCKAE